MPNTATRRLEFRVRTAIDLLDLPIDREAMVDLAGRQEKTSYHRVFSPEDLERVRSQLQPSLVAKRAHRKQNGQVPPILVSHISKGGTGKTTVMGNLALAIAMQGYRVLLIDADPQASMTTLMGIDPEASELITLGSLIKGVAKLGPSIPFRHAVHQIYENATLDFIAADNEMNRFERETASLVDRSRLFSGWLHAARQDLAEYDVILVDTNPASSILNFNLMIAATAVMAVVMLDGLSMKAITSLLADMEEIRETQHKDVPLLFVANGIHLGKKHTRDNYDILKAAYGGHLADTVIPEYAGFGRQGRPGGESRLLLESEPGCQASKLLLELSRQIVRVLIQPAASPLQQTA